MKRYDEADQVLRKALQQHQNCSSVEEKNLLGASYALLGKICKCLCRDDAAKDNFLKALKINEFCFEAIEELERMGVDSKSSFSLKHCYKLFHENVLQDTNSVTDHLAQKEKKLERKTSRNESIKASILNFEKKRTRSGEKKVENGTEVSENISSMAVDVDQNNVVLVKKDVSVSSSVAIPEPFVDFCDLLGKYVKSLHLYHSSRLTEVSTTISKLPLNHAEGPWILALLAKISFDSIDYPQARKYFEKLKSKMPHRIKDMDKYSTVLWHLKDQKALSYLAQSLMKLDPMSPEAFVALGNSFSLAKEHENAISCFEKATKIKEDYAYGYNLLGFEYCSNEAFDNAVVAFRTSLKCNSRLSSAWFGLGSIYMKQEKFDLALYHFDKALQISKSNTILYCHLGMALHKLRRFDEALLVFDKGIQLDLRNPQIRYRKAMCLMDLRRNDEALKELNNVLAKCPLEGGVWYKMGEIHKALGRREEALECFLHAGDLMGKSGGSTIREKLQDLYRSDKEMVERVYKLF